MYLVMIFVYFFPYFKLIIVMLIMIFIMGTVTVIFIVVIIIIIIIIIELLKYSNNANIKTYMHAFTIERIPLEQTFLLPQFVGKCLI